MQRFKADPKGLSNEEINDCMKAFKSKTTEKVTFAHFYLGL